MDGLHAREVLKECQVADLAQDVCVLGLLETDGENVCRLLEGNIEDERYMMHGRVQVVLVSLCSMQKQLCSRFSLDAGCTKYLEPAMQTVMQGACGNCRLDARRGVKASSLQCVCHTACIYTAVLVMRLSRCRGYSVRILPSSPDLSDNASTSPRHIHMRNRHLIPAPRTGLHGRNGYLSDTHLSAGETKLHARIRDGVP
jgi:hypothetical protein